MKAKFKRLTRVPCVKEVLDEEDVVMQGAKCSNVGFHNDRIYSGIGSVDEAMTGFDDDTGLDI